MRPSNIEAKHLSLFFTLGLLIVGLSCFIANQYAYRLLPDGHQRAMQEDAKVAGLQMGILLALSLFIFSLVMIISKCQGRRNVTQISATVVDYPNVFDDQSQHMPQKRKQPREAAFTSEGQRLLPGGSDTDGADGTSDPYTP